MSSSGVDSGIDWKPLVEAATRARANSHSPYSRFAVGAALLTEDGSIFAGCNVENRSFGATICAERAAVTAAVAAGHRKFRAIVVITDTEPPAPPCGLCREVLAEFAGGDLPILGINPAGTEERYRLGDVFPHPFEFPPRH